MKGASNGRKADGRGGGNCIGHGSDDGRSRGWRGVCLSGVRVLLPEPRRMACRLVARGLASSRVGGMERWISGPRLGSAATLVPTARLASASRLVPAPGVRPTAGLGRALRRTAFRSVPPASLLVGLTKPVGDDDPRTVNAAVAEQNTLERQHTGRTGRPPRATTHRSSRDPATFATGIRLLAQLGRGGMRCTARAGFAGTRWAWAALR